MIEEFFVPPVNPVTKWFNRGVGRAYQFLPYTVRRSFLRRLLDGEAGVRWVEKYIHEPLDLSHPKYARVAARVAQFERVHWIGCCSGREVAHYASLFPATRFVASDMSSSIVDWCARHYQLPNLRFMQVDAVTHDFGDDLVVAPGVLTYMDAGEIAVFARRVRRLVAAEPVTVGHGQFESTYRGRMAWNHPYKRLFDCSSYEEIPGDGARSVVFSVERTSCS